jgi:hypothetical protein
MREPAAWDGALYALVGVAARERVRLAMGAFCLMGLSTTDALRVRARMPPLLPSFHSSCVEVRTWPSSTPHAHVYRTVLYSLEAGVVSTRLSPTHGRLDLLTCVPVGSGWDSGSMLSASGSGAVMVLGVGDLAFFFQAALTGGGCSTVRERE